jgi:hypothetical protein
MSSRQNWDSPIPSLASECALPPGTKGGEGTRLRVRGGGSPNSDDRWNSLALCLLCDLTSFPKFTAWPYVAPLYSVSFSSVDQNTGD